MYDKVLDVIVIGELNVDLILNRIDGFPEMGKEKLAGKMSLTLGSSSAIFASNLSALEARVGFLGKLGEDSFADLVMASLEKKGVDTSMIIRDPGLNTGATVVLNYDEDRAMVTHPGAMEHLSIDDISDDQLRQARHLHFSSYYLQPGLKKDIADLFKRARELDLTTSFDMQWDPAEHWDLDYPSVLPFVDVFLPNEQELMNLSGKSSIDEALDAITPYAHIVAVKKGGEGSLCAEKDDAYFMPSFKNKNVVDAIGAGDSFNAGFIFKYIAAASLRECQKFANLMGAINTTAPGGTTAFRDYEQIISTGREIFGYRGK